MDQDLQNYLNDHLAGSEGALVLLKELQERTDDPSERTFFGELSLKIKADQDVLRQILDSAGLEESTLARTAGNLTAKVSRLKLYWEGMEPGKLGMFEALEMLTLGIQGKRMLWVVLGEIASYFPEWKEINFAELELQAIDQRDSVEKCRIEAGRESLPSPERKRRLLATA